MKFPSCQVIRAVWKRETAAAASSPALWVFLIIFLVLAAFLSLVVGGIFASGQADLTPFFAWFPWLFLFLIPALGMPFWSEERRTGTFELLLSFPATLRELVWGKFLAGMTLLAVALALTAGTPLSAHFLGEPDSGAVFCGYAGAFLLGGVFLAVASFASALTRSQTAAFLLSLVICALFLTAGAPPVLNWLGIYLPDAAVNVLAFLAFLPHYQAFQRGFVDTSDLVYCLGAVIFFLYLAESVLKFAASGTGNIFAPGAWRERTTRRATARLLLRFVLALYALACVNVIAAAFPFQADLSRDGAYSLSPETRAFAASLTKEAEIRLYASISSPRMPEELKRYARRVEWLLRSLCRASAGKLTLRVLDPEPDSGDEQAAHLEGLEPANIYTGDRIYLGFSVSCADKCLSTPFLSLRRENLLEYEIVRTVLNAMASERPKVGVMSAFKVMGDAPSPQLTALNPEKPKVYQRAWYAISELAKDYRLAPLELNVPEIPPDLSALLIIHPAGISARTLYALDQYLMRGGRMAVFLDPRSFYAALKMRSDYAMADKLASGLKPLTTAWGVGCDSGMIAADMLYAHRELLPDRMVTNPAALELSGRAISRANPLTASLKTVSMWFAAPLSCDPPPGITAETLLATSPNSQTASVYLAARPDLLIRYFKPGGKSMPLALRLSGDFPSAYPHGPPFATGQVQDHRIRSGGQGEVFLFGDSDMLFNELCVRTVPDECGRRTAVRTNDNLTLLQSVMEQLTDFNRFLSRIRTRKPMNRPLTRYNELRARAETVYKDRVQELERELLTTAAQARAVRSSLAAGALSEKQQRTLRQYQAKTAQVTRELKEVRRQLRADLNRLDTLIKVINLVAVPLAVALVGLAWAGRRFSRRRRRI